MAKGCVLRPLGFTQYVAYRVVVVVGSGGGGGGSGGRGGGNGCHPCRSLFVPTPRKRELIKTACVCHTF